MFHHNLAQKFPFFLKHNLLTFNVYQVVTYQKGGGHEIISLLQVIKPQATSLLFFY